MPRSCRSRRVQSWIAAVSAYALALQVLLSGIVAGQLVAADIVSGDSQFSICHGGGSPNDGQPGNPGSTADKQVHCALCVLASASPGVLPAAHTGSIVVAETVSGVLLVSDDRIDAFHSPTGQYQRGPPAGLHTVS